MAKDARSRRFLAVLALLALVLPLPPLPGPQTKAETHLPAPTAASLGSGAGIRINEVMPKPEESDFEWVEMYRPRIFLVYLPLVLRNAAGSLMVARQVDSPPRQSVSLSGQLDISGWQVTDEDGNSYTIPDALPQVPHDTYVLIIFDGLGPWADDYDFGDGVAVLHSPPDMVDIFEDAADQMAVYTSSSFSPDSIVDFVAWGAPPAEDAANASAAGLWDVGWYASFQRGFGDISDEGLLLPNESLGRYPGSTGTGPQALALYLAGQLTPNGANPVPAPSYYTPGYGAVVETTTFSVSWSPAPGAVGYALQLDDDPAFGSPAYDTTFTETYFKPPAPLVAGTYYWRIKALGPEGEEGPWSGPVEIGIAEFSPLANGRGIQPEVVLGITPVRQNKNSRLLCLDGDPEGSPSTADPENAWDAAAPCTVPPCTDYTKFIHGEMYCVPASIKMMASHYGGILSMDRIAYHMMQEWEASPYPDAHDSNPNNDLGHNRGWHYPDEESEGLSWALGTTIPAMGGRPSFDDIKASIDDAGRPVMFRDPGHMMVIDGYREIGGEGWIHILDPDQPPDCERWQLYVTQNIDGYWPGPASAPNVRSDEATVSTDSDGDGIMDFDEENRLPTSHTETDSDNDGQSDKIDMSEYVFDSSGNYSYRDPDGVDNDGLRKEIDPDNDNGGSLDGCEDTNRNGRYEPWLGETSNFDPVQEKQCGAPNDMVFIPAGVFQRGCDPDHNDGLTCSAHQLPLRSIYLDAYYIDRYEVTNAQYAQCVTAGVCTPPDSNSSYTRPSYYNDPVYGDYPVMHMDWDQAFTYCAWVDKRLPTEAEWEKAARGSGTPRAYPWGDETPDCTLANYQADPAGSPCIGDTTPVGSYPAGASPYGVLDMAGNVWEWVYDWYSDTYYSEAPDHNPEGPATGTYRVNRGGHWRCYRDCLHAAYRFPVLPESAGPSRGIRCAADP